MSVAVVSKRESARNYQTALFLLASTTVGVGYMTYPKLCANVGVGNVLIICACCGLVSLFYTSLLLRVHLLRKADNYPDLIRKVLGEGHYFAMLAVLTFYVTSSMIPQLTMMVKLADRMLLRRLHSLAALRPDGSYAWVPYAAVVGVATLLSFCDLRHIRKLSYVGNFFSLYLGFILIAQAAHHVFRHGITNEFRLFKLSPEILSTIATCLFSFTNQVTLIPIVRVLKQDSDYLHFATLLRSQYLGFLLYTNVAVSGYLLTGAAAPAFIVNKPGEDGLLESLFQLGCACLLCSLSVTFCLKVLSLRDFGMCMYDDLRAGRPSSAQTRRGVQVAVSVVTGLLAVVVSVRVSNDIMEFISLACSVLCPYIIFVCPTLMALRLRNELGISRRRALFLRVAMLACTTVLLCAIAKTGLKVLGPYLFPKRVSV